MTKTITKKPILAAIIAITFVAGSITTGAVVFADDDEEEQPKTLEEECAEELDDDDIDLEGLFCLAIFDLQSLISRSPEGVLTLDAGETGTVEVTGNLDVSGDAFLGDTTIASDLIIGPTNIDSVTGDVEVGGAFTCNGCIDSSDITPGAISLDVIEVSATVFSTSGFAAASATCPPDRILVGGGGGFFTNGVMVSFLTQPDELIPNTWNATVVGGVVGTSVTAESIAMCAKLVP